MNMDNDELYAYVYSRLIGEINGGSIALDKPN